MGSPGSEIPFLSSKIILYPSKRPNDIPKFVKDAKIKFDYQVRVMEISETKMDKTNSENSTPTLVPGPIIDDTRKSHPDGYGQPLELVLGKKFKVPAWETCLQTMRFGEVASFVLPPIEVLEYPFVSKQLRDIAKDQGCGGDHAHRPIHGGMCGGMAAALGLGYPQLDALMKEPKPLMVTFELLEVTAPEGYEPESWQMEVDEKLKSLPVMKEKGNALFKEGKLDEACDAYGEALSRLENLMVMEKPGEPEYKELEVLKIPFYLNIAQCKLQAKEFYAAIQAVNEVFEKCEGPFLQKALFRRGKANVGAWNFEEARDDFEKMRELFPESERLANVELRKLEKVEKAAKEDKGGCDMSKAFG